MRKAQIPAPIYAENCNHKRQKISHCRLGTGRVDVELGCGVLTMNEQEKLARYFHEWQHNKNPVTRSSYRNMALNLYSELYIF